ncbi:MAG: chemotaxis protein CheA, partial [Thermodesulfobacteriota bacterium]
MTDLDKLKAVFINEAREIIEELDGMLVNLEHTSDDRELLNAVFRHLHTLKGSGGMVEFRALEILAHAEEDLLDYLRTENISPTQEMLDLFFEGLDTIKVLIETFAKGEEPSTSLTDDLAERFRTFLPCNVPISEEEIDRERLEVNFFSAIPEEVKENARQHFNKGSRLYQISINLEGDALKAGLDPIPPLKGLTHIGDIIYASSDPLIPHLQEMDPTFLYIDSILILFASSAGVKEIREVFEFLTEAGDIDIHPLTPLDLKEYIGIEIDEFWSDSMSGKVGEILVKSGMIEEEEVERALSIQDRSIGRILVDEKIARPEDVDKALKIQQKQKAGLTPSQFIRIDTEKVDTLVNLVGELVIANTIVSQSRAVQDIGDTTFQKNANQLTKIIKEIQDQTMSLRMVPLRQTFQKMARIVRDVARKDGKEVDFLIKGEDTELDKRLIDQIGDPLVHLLRNAVDHGIESVEERVRKGKNGKGVVSLNAFHQSGNIVIEVGDDGKGIDREKIIEKAVERGLIENHDLAEALTDEEIYRFMFRQGFSTAAA